MESATSGSDSPWTAFLGEVDEVEDKEVTEKMAKLFVAKGWKIPSTLAGADDKELLEGMAAETNAPERAFVRRCIKLANAIAEARLQAAADATSVPASQGAALTQGSIAASQPELLASLQSLMGNEQSALTVATALASGESKPDVTKLMKDAGLDSIEDAFCPGNEVYTALMVDGEAAKKVGHTAFTYVDLTNQNMLPDFLPPEAVGGKTVVPGHEDCLSGYTGNLGQLGSALRALTTAPRFFRNIGQWVTAFMRSAVAAVATKQVTWCFVNVHMQVVLRVNIEESTVVAIIYDELARKTWARKAAKGDTSLNIFDDASKKDPQLVELAKSKVKLVTKAAGLQQGQENSGGSQPSFGAAEASLSKQVAMAQKVQKDADMAVSRLHNQRNAAFQAGGSSYSGGNKGQKRHQGQQGQQGQSWQKKKKPANNHRGGGKGNGKRY